MIGAGTSPKAVQVVLGHRSAAFTLTVYGHLFDADLDDLAPVSTANRARLPNFRGLTAAWARDEVVHRLERQKLPLTSAV